jgi:succinylglutamic semialdehyde dehydrogenase
MGPLISRQAREAVLGAQRAMMDAPDTARVLVACEAWAPLAERGGTQSNEHGWYCTPGVVQVESFNTADDCSLSAGADVEVFGPLVRVSIARDIEHAIQQANATRFGLAASLFSKDATAIDRFLHECRAGCLNVNTGTAGASSKLPFGGLGLSGNHRPSGSFSTDYCAYPVASMIERGDAAVIPAGMRFEEGWVGGE